MPLTRKIENELSTSKLAIIYNNPRRKTVSGLSALSEVGVSLGTHHHLPEPLKKKSQGHSRVSDIPWVWGPSWLRGVRSLDSGLRGALRFLHPRRRVPTMVVDSMLPRQPWPCWATGRGGQSCQAAAVRRTMSSWGRTRCYAQGRQVRAVRLPVSSTHILPGWRCLPSLRRLLESFGDGMRKADSAQMKRRRTNRANR